MNKILLKSNLTLIQKICLAGLFIAMTTIFQKITAINYIPVLPFVRISFGGVAMVMFSSILLGPWFGLLVGAASDVLGYFVFDMSGMGFFPQITAIYALLGFISYFVFSIIRLIKNDKLLFGLEIGFLALLVIAISIYIGVSDELIMYGTTYSITTAIRIAAPCVLASLTGILILALILINKKTIKGSTIMSTYAFSFSALILELFVMVLFGSLMKGLAFGFETYLVILISQLIVLFFNVPFNTIVLSLLGKISRKYY